MASAIVPTDGPLALLPEGGSPPAATRAAAPAAQTGAGARGPAGGPGGKAPLVKAIRSKQPELRRAALAWLDRFAADPHAALAELVSLVLIVADVPWRPEVEREDVRDQDPVEVVQELVAKVAMEASEKGADFTQHWLVSREKGSARVRENYPAFWRELGAAAPCQALLSGLLQLLRGWVQALADCCLRSVRHAAALAGLQLVEGLGQQCRSMRDFCGAATVQVRDAEAQGAAARCRSLSSELERAQHSLRDLGAARDALGAALLSRRTKDADVEVRRCCFEAIARWAPVDPDTFLAENWTRYLHFGLCDRDAKARSAVLAALLELLRGAAGSPSSSVQSLAESLRPRILARCHDVDASVGAAAVRCASALAAMGALADADFDPVVDLVWDADAERRGEAASFVSRFVFSEDVLDYASAGLPAGALLPTGRDGGAAAQRRLVMLLQFLGEYAEGHYQLVDRLASALWGRASCLEDWEVLASMVLPGTERSLSGDQHTALVHLAEAVARLATEDVAVAAKPEAVAHAEAVLDRAGRAFAPRIPALMEACQSEPAAVQRAAGLCRHLLRHCAAPAPGGEGRRLGGIISGPVGEVAAGALKTAFLRQPDPEALEYFAESLAHLLDLSTSARPVVHELAGQLRERFLEVAPALSSSQQVEISDAQVPPADALLSSATRLRILAKAFDVSLCDLRTFVATALGLLDDRAAAVAENRSPAVGPLLATTLLELLVLLLTRHVAAYLQPEPLARCVMHDPVNQDELRLAPTAANDLCSVASTLLKVDPNPQVRTAAFTSSLALLTGSWNTARFASSAAQAVAAGGEVAAQPAWVLQMSEELGVALCGHLGELLTEANSVPLNSGISPGAPEPGSVKQASAFSQLFNSIQRVLAVAAASGGGDAAALAAASDSERVHMGVLACALLAACRHPEVERSHLPALVLSQALSPREDMQEASWVLLRRLRKEAHWQADSAEAFFMALLHTVKLVHQDAGVGVARDLSFRLMQRVAVGKLSPTSQAGLIAALRQGAEMALAGEGREGLLEAMVPWVTKHIVEDDLLEDLAVWCEQQGAAYGGRDPEGAATLSGLWVFLTACHATTRRGHQPPAAPALAAAPATPAPAARAQAAASPMDVEGGEAEPLQQPSPAAPRSATAAFGGRKRRRTAAAEPTPSTPVATVPATPTEDLYHQAIPQPRILGPSL